MNYKDWNHPIGLTMLPQAQIQPSKESIMMMTESIECHGLDTPQQVFFYEQDFYVLSNFSSFAIRYRGKRYPTAEHLYHWYKFVDTDGYESKLAKRIRKADSAHEAFQLAQEHKAERHDDWDEAKVAIMRNILMLKLEQHEYVRRKLMATGDRELIENSWRDDFWGWGPNKDGQNMLGKLWMEIRTEMYKEGL